MNETSEREMIMIHVVKPVTQILIPLRFRTVTQFVLVQARIFQVQKRSMKNCPPLFAMFEKNE